MLELLKPDRIALYCVFGIVVTVIARLACEPDENNVVNSVPSAAAIFVMWPLVIVFAIIIGAIRVLKQMVARAGE